MDSYGISMLGDLKVRVVANASAEAHTAGDEGNVIYDQTTDRYWIATATAWVRMPNGDLNDMDDTSLAAPGADRVLFWDQSEGAYTWLTVGSGLVLADTTLTATGASGGVDALKGWVNFSGTVDTVSITSARGSYNVSALADNATGDYTITWYTDFADVGYVLAGSATGYGSSNLVVGVTAQFVGSSRILLKDTGSTARDATIVNIMASGTQ
jgi:hypothetical protein